MMRKGLLLLILPLLLGAQYRTKNFVITTASPSAAREIGQAAERFRHDLAVYWLGKAMPNWAAPCPIVVTISPNLDAGGATTFYFDRGEVFGWRMNIQGSHERVLDSVLPHEITHMIFASHFRRPLPRWADEGGATFVEHQSEKKKHRRELYKFLRNGRGISLPRLFVMTEYPRDIMPLYAQGYSIVELLVGHKGPRTYIRFLEDSFASGSWPVALKKHYGITSVRSLQEQWMAWVRRGCPAIAPSSRPEASPVMLASHEAPVQPPAPRPGSAEVAPADSVRTVSQDAKPWRSIYETPELAARMKSTDAAVFTEVATGRQEVASRPTAGWHGIGDKAAGSRASALRARQPDLLATRTVMTSLASVPIARTPLISLKDLPKVLPAQQQVAHPQPIGRPGQVILEWHR